MAIILKFDPHRVEILLKNGKIEVITCEPPSEFDYDSIKKIWEYADD